MKSLVKFAAVAAVAVMAVSCCKCNDKCDQPCDQQCEAPCPAPDMQCPPMCCPEGPKDAKCPMFDKMRAMDEKWVKFDELSDAEKKALISEKKALIDSIEARRAAMIEKAKKDWENFDNLSMDEQKRLLDMKSHHQRRGCGKKCGPRQCGPKGQCGPQHGPKGAPAPGPRPDGCQK